MHKRKEFISAVLRRALPAHVVFRQSLLNIGLRPNINGRGGNLTANSKMTRFYLGNALEDLMDFNKD